MNPKAEVAFGPHARTAAIALPPRHGGASLVADLYEISDEVRFAAAHRLRFTDGEGERLHGHTWRVRATLRSRSLDRRGMVKDFADLHAALAATALPFENRLINDVVPFDDESSPDSNPSAENLASLFARELQRRLSDGRVTVHRVEVWETETCCATFFPE
ncbi:MAG: 6-carboxytetrahydropterin synthase [Deltaproteobacteria bacterium]|nr:6-carboxytetrahydropterin synthase [Deltaproteobacteria bacterium]